MSLVYGLITGILFGFLLQKGEVIRYDKQLGALRFQDMTILKFMLSAIVTAMIGIHLLLDFGVVSLSLKPTILGANIVGGALFGIGWALLGYCPGTAAGALGEGRWDSLWGILGMLAGAALYAEVYPAMKATLLSWGGFGKITLPQVLGVGQWPVITGFAVVVLILFAVFETRKL